MVDVEETDSAGPKDHYMRAEVQIEGRKREEQRKTILNFVVIGFGKRVKITFFIFSFV